MSILKQTAREYLPPILFRWLHNLRSGRIHFEGEYTNWQEAAASCTGYDAQNILEKVLQATLKVKRGEAAYERDSVIFDEIEYAWPLLAGLMWVAARNSGTLNVLDIGGALGSSYFQNRMFLDSLKGVRWNVVEQLHFVNAGNDYLNDGRLRFYPTIDSCLEENHPNIILLSSVLQYLENPSDILSRLHLCGATTLIIDRTPFATLCEHKLLIQRVPAKIYEASYPMWVFALPALLRALEENWRLVSKIPCTGEQFKASSGLRLSFEGILLEART